MEMPSVFKEDLDFILSRARQVCRMEQVELTEPHEVAWGDVLFRSMTGDTLSPRIWHEASGDYAVHAECRGWSYAEFHSEFSFFLRRFGRVEFQLVFSDADGKARYRLRISAGFDSGYGAVDVHDACMNRSGGGWNVGWFEGESQKLGRLPPDLDQAFLRLLPPEPEGVRRAMRYLDEHHGEYLRSVDAVMILSAALDWFAGED